MEKFIEKMMRRSMILDFYEDLDEYLEDMEDLGGRKDISDDLGYLEEFENNYY